MAVKSILDSFLADQGYALFEYAENGVFRPLGEYPAWCQKLWKNAVARDNSIHLTEASPLLENFLVDAEAFWNSNRDGSANSPVWIERDSAGKEVPLEAAALHLDGKNVLLLRNLSRTYADRQKLYQTARDALLDHERLTRETQKKEILLHCIVHDLSQPLTVMRGCFSLLALEDLSAELRRTVEAGQLESIRQEQMIRGILQAFSADLAGAQTSDNVPSAADIAACAQRTVQEFSPAFEDRKIRLQLDPAVDLKQDWIVAGDDSRLERIFGNLLENALRYSPPNTTVTIGLEEKGKQVLAYVDDQGPGLPKDQSQEQMFALFGKGKDKPGKAGLGLYFCKITVERWGGTIGAETRASSGTRFWFRLPRAAKSARDVVKKEAPRQPDALPLKETPAAGARPGLEKPAKSLRILVAEDTDENRELVSELLKRRGHTVVGVSDGRKALEALAKDSYDVVLMDEQMPVMDGLEATRAIRAKEKSTGKRQVIVALTGNVTEEDTQRRIEAGMDGFVPKPFEMKALFETIEFLGTFGNQVIAAGPPPSKTPPSTERPEAKPQPKPAAPVAAPDENVATHLRRTTGGNQKLADSLTKSFLSDAPKRLAAIRAAVAAKDPKKLDTAAHALKGSAAIFGAPATVDAARSLEAMGKTRNLAGAGAALRSLEAAMKDLQSELVSLTLQKQMKPKEKASSKGRRKK
jgi:signal transduction histidine kinase/DNA-binding NarL/FixJ family response regulator/HPt (histidine-containing phosphotransfer) domain-containing protein